MRTLVLLSMIIMVEITATKAYSLDVSTTGPAARSAAAHSLTTQVPDFDKSYKRNRVMQIVGYAMLGTSAVLTITGAALVEGSPWGPVARAGIISFGVGLAHFITAAFLLGFSQVIIRQELPPLRPVQIVPKSARNDRCEGDIYF